MKQAIEMALSKIGDETSIVKWESVSGGSINQAFYVSTGKQEYFAKLNRTAPDGFFKAEEKGLNILSSHGIRVPKPLVLLPRGETEMVFLMEWISPARSNKQSERSLGRLVANMHHNTVDMAGLDHSNYIGELHQENNQTDDWVTFYRDQRLGIMQDIANEAGVLSGDRDRRLTKMRERLDLFIGHKPDFSLLHGDLWDGNRLVNENDEPYLIDPAVYYGDREIDIAFTYLFGGYTEGFYAQYDADYPLEKEWEDRIPVYQLYYLLVHLVLFGESYGSAVDRILQKYTT
ncbi:fructosamine kinase family protein [Pseudalkalibacillus hwajinpoensis]|uniref:fructosamine kinase family protein n=1 Tax=Guptibacillus hwajinpoensis TaxID=208199 RepID=UPI00325B7F08